MTDFVSRAGLGGSLVAFFAATTCCVLPMSLMIAGLGGSWLAVFAPIAAVSPYLIGLSVVLLVAAWILALRRGSSRRTKAMLTTGSVFAAAGWLIVANSDRVTLFFLSYM